MRLFSDSFSFTVLFVATALVGGSAADGDEKADASTAPAVAILLEDNAAELLPKLTNPQGGSGEGHVESADVFAGRSCVRIVPDQRYARSIPDWKYRIVEKPAAGEYRYLRFAWKAPGCSGVMLQLHDDHDWKIRYTAGGDKYGWGTRFLGAKPPDKWSLTTVDLFKESGERTIRGMALTCFDGPAGYFDHIYLARTIEDLDRIDATPAPAKPRPDLTERELNAHWEEANSSVDASLAYRSFWALANAKAAVPFLAAKLRTTEKLPASSALNAWIAQLDHENFEKREEASENLAKYIRIAADLLDAELKRTTSPEVKSRIKQLLKQKNDGDPSADRAEKAVRILEFSRSVEAQSALREIAQGPQADRVAQLAREALERFKARQ
jgi:hypothetical protein